MKFYIILLLSLFSLNNVHAMTYLQAKVATALTGLTVVGATGYYMQDDIKKIFDQNSTIKSNSPEIQQYCTALAFAWAGTIAGCFFFKRYTPRGYYQRGLEAINDLDHNLLVRIISSHKDKELLRNYCKSLYRKYDLPLVAACNDLRAHENKVVEINSILQRAIEIKDAEPEIVIHAHQIIKKFNTSTLPAIRSAQTYIKTAELQ